MDDGGEVEEVEVPVDVADPGATVLKVVKASATLGEQSLLAAQQLGVSSSSSGELLLILLLEAPPVQSNYFQIHSTIVYIQSGLVQIQSTPVLSRYFQISLDFHSAGH